jgi:hypothetical protein
MATDLLGSDIDPQFRQLRTWTNSTGTHIEAACINVNDASVYLITSSGRRANYPVKKLSAADQAYCRELHRRTRVFTASATPAPEHEQARLANQMKRKKQLAKRRRSRKSSSLLDVFSGLMFPGGFK